MNDSALASEIANKFLRLVEVIAQLRAPGGCPWDQKQTPATFRTYLLEEVYELVEAIDTNQADEVREELGDLFFQLIFVNNLFAEQGHFTLAEVLETITNKMIRRHPHVFGERKVESEAELKRQWHSIKAAEKKKSRLMQVPRSLPALRRADRLLERAGRVGLAPPAADLLERELDTGWRDLRHATAAEDPQAVAGALGRLFLLLVLVGRRFSLSCEEVLGRVCDEFVHLFSQQEAAAAPDLPDLSGAAGHEFWRSLCRRLGGCRAARQDNTA